MKKVVMTSNLPKVGDRLWLIMTASQYDADVMYRADQCIVTYVNLDHNWFQVIFPDIQIKECYKTPRFDHRILSNLRKACSIPVLCVETGEIFSSTADCAKYFKMSSSGITRQLNGDYESSNGYHFEKIM